jgi:hypothetical protein
MSAEKEEQRALLTTAEPSVHVTTAQVRIEELRAMRAAIPYFVVPVSKADERRVVSAASVPPEFVNLMATAITNFPDLQRPTSNPAAVRDLVDFADAYTALADEFEVNARFLRHTIRVARKKAAGVALSTYALAKNLATQPETGELGPYVDEMSRALGVRAARTEKRLARKKTAAAVAAAKTAAKKDGLEPLAPSLPEQQ